MAKEPIIMYNHQDDSISIVDSVHTLLHEKELRRIMVLLWRNNPDVIRDIVCEDCPEHIEVVRNENYHLNRAERGK